MLVKSEQAWKQYQEQRGRPPLYKLMEEGYQHKKEAEEQTRRMQYEMEIAAGKMATVSQLVKVGTCALAAMCRATQQQHVPGQPCIAVVYPSACMQGSPIPRVACQSRSQ